MPLHLFLVFPGVLVGTFKSKHDLLVGLWLSQVGIYCRVLLGTVSLAESSGGRISIVVATSFCQSCSLMKLLWTNTYSDTEPHVAVFDMVGFR